MHQLAFIDGSTLLYVREEKGVTADFLSRKAGVSLERLKRWEASAVDDYPTMRQAEKIAKTLLVPLAGLYMQPSKIPVLEKPLVANMRRPFDSEYGDDDSQINLAIEWLCSLRAQMLETLSDLEEEFPDVRLPVPSDSAISDAASVRKYLGITFEDQRRCGSSRQLFLLIRKRLEQRGVLVAQYANVEIEAGRGIALFFDKCPIIGVNEDDRWPGQTFSVFHELGHLLKRSSAICNQMDLSAALSEEVYCNSLAGEALVPAADFERVLSDFEDPKEMLVTEKIAKIFSVSREVISRRLFDRGYIGKAEYEERISFFNDQLIEEKEREREHRKSGEAVGFSQPIERTVVDKHGSIYCETLLHGIDRGLYSDYEVSRILGVKTEKLPAIFREVAQ